MALMNIRKIGDPVLRSKAKEVKNIDQKTRDLIENMTDTMYEADGIGLAAPQVGVLQRLFIVDVGNGLIEIINPKITQKQGKSIMEEGCLSIPEETGSVVRPKEIVMEGYNKDGEKIKIEADGLLARALQHEYDHLEGNLFTDKVIDEEKLEVEIQE